MFKVKPPPVHQFLARIPELNYVLLRDKTTNQLEIWTPSRGIELNAIRLHGQEFEYVRDADAAYRVIDVDYNRDHAPHEIGRVYVDNPPIGVVVKEL